MSPISIRITPRKKLFRFESMWLTDEGCRSTVEVAWKSNSDGPHMMQLWNRVNRCRRRLSSWSRQCFGSVRRQLADKRSQLQAAELLSMQGGDHHQLREGDRNTRFFHSHATQRWRRNAILGLRDERGEWCEQTDQVAWIALDYFQTLFQTAGPTEI
ncbi:putative ribonuclease h protein [Fagus crenata]